VVAGAVVGFGRVVKVRVVGAAEIAHAGAKDYREVIGGFQACGQVGTGLALHDIVLAAARDVWFSVFAVPIEDAAAHGRVDRTVHRHILFRAGGHEAHDQLVFTTEQAERPAEVHVQGVLHLVALVLAHEHVHVLAADRVRVAAASGGEQGVVLAALAVEADFERPVIRQLLLHRGEECLVVEVATAPVGGRVERAREVRARAVAEVHRETGPTGTAGAGVLLIDAEGQQGVGREVGFKDAVGDVLGVLVVVQVRLAILVHADKTPAHVAGLRQWAGDVAFGAVVVPGTEGLGYRGLEGSRRLFANQVDRGRRVAGAAQQAGRPLDDFQVVVHRHVGAGGAVVIYAVIGGVDTVVLEVGDRQATAGELPALAVVVLHAHAGGAAQGVGDAVGALVVHLLAGDHRHRLRGFTHRQRQAGGRSHGAGGVGTGVFGGGAQVLAGNRGGTQLQRAGVGGNRVQHVTVVALGQGLQTAALQQALQAGRRGVVAVQAGAGLAGGEAVVAGDENARLLGEVVQHTDQGAGGDAVGTRGLLARRRVGGVHHRRAKAEQRSGQRQWAQREASRLRHGCFPLDQIDRRIESVYRVNRTSVEKGNWRLKIFYSGPTDTHHGNGRSTRIGSAACNRCRA